MQQRFSDGGVFRAGPSECLPFWEQGCSVFQETIKAGHFVACTSGGGGGSVVCCDVVLSKSRWIDRRAWTGGQWTRLGRVIIRCHSTSRIDLVRFSGHRRKGSRLGDSVIVNRSGSIVGNWDSNSCSDRCLGAGGMKFQRCLGAGGMKFQRRVDGVGQTSTGSVCAVHPRGAQVTENTRGCVGCIVACT